MNFTATSLLEVRDVSHGFRYTTVTFKLRVCLMDFTVPPSIQVRDFLSIGLHCSSVTLG